MLRFQSALASLLASALVTPVFLGQGSIATLEDALAGTQRALEVVKGLERKLQEDPAAALALLLSATEPPALDEPRLDARFENLRNEVSLLQMELDALQSPALAGVPPSERAALPLPAPDAGLGQPPLTTGLDDSLRALLASDSPFPPLAHGRAPVALDPRTGAGSGAAAGGYSADPLRHGIACYRAGRHAEALLLLEPLDSAEARYWTARTLERLERLDDAITAMERALAAAAAAPKDAHGFEPRRAESDLEFLRWKRDFVRGVRSADGKEPR